MDVREWRSSLSNVHIQIAGRERTSSVRGCMTNTEACCDMLYDSAASNEESFVPGDTASAIAEVAGDGDSLRSGNLFGEVYAELKVIARRELARAAGSTLNTTSIVHELFLKMCARRDLEFEARPQFFLYAAQAIRHILIDHARRRLTIRLGGNQVRAPLTDPAVDDLSMSSQHALQLDEALSALQQADARAARVVELHYFAGLSLQRVADLLGVARRTIDRDWRYARSFLMAHID